VAGPAGSGPTRSRMLASVLPPEAGMCITTSSAASISAGTPVSTDRIASSPPADAPMVTTLRTDISTSSRRAAAPGSGSFAGNHPRPLTYPFADRSTRRCARRSTAGGTGVPSLHIVGPGARLDTPLPWHASRAAAAGRPGGCAHRRRSPRRPPDPSSGIGCPRRGARRRPARRCRARDQRARHQCPAARWRPPLADAPPGGRRGGRGRRGRVHRSRPGSWTRPGSPGGGTGWSSCWRPSRAPRCSRVASGSGAGSAGTARSRRRTNPPSEGVRRAPPLA
jgi:hypothetical protein